MIEFENILEPKKLPCMTKLWRPVIPNRKEEYLTPHQLKSHVLNSPRILAVIKELAENDQIKTNRLKITVKDMLDEIGLTRNLTVVRWIGILLNSIFKRTSTGVYVNKTSIENLKKTIGTCPVLYLPSHRSYLDFILMSYICFTYDLEIPGIAAGMDFHGMIGIGSALRKTGAFFMRRSFATDKLYWYVFKEYMRSLVTVYHIGIEFFIEGTRSRSCKALMPKIGLLSMALEPLFMSEVPDILIVPVGVAYDKPLEEQLFTYEMLGVPKPKESTLGLLKGLQILDSNYGSMYVNFGEPISVKQYFGEKLRRFEHAQIPAHVQTLTKSELGFINELSHTVISSQQKLIVISTFNLISIYYNYRINSSKTVTLADMCLGVRLLVNVFKSMGALVSIDTVGDITLYPDVLREEIIEALHTHSNILRLTTSTKSSKILSTLSNSIKTSSPSSMTPVLNTLVLPSITLISDSPESDEYIEMVKPIIFNLQNIDKEKLKGYNLSENTMRNTVPTVTLQLYSNPCLYWMVQPAIIILITKFISQSGIQQTVEIDKLKTENRIIRKIFAIEFVLNSYNEEKDFERSLDFLVNKVNILQENNEDYSMISGNGGDTNELPNIFLNSIAPFLCCYYQVADTILLEFNNCYFTEKELLVKVQQRIENGLNSKQSYIHPYCLSLDSINIALSSLHSIDCINKEKNSSNVKYSSNNNLLLKVKNLLENYCSILPFNYLNNYLIFSKL